MIKINRGSIGDKEGNWKDIVVRAAMPNKPKDLLIGGVMLLAGIGYLTYTAFQNGVEAMDMTYMQTLYESNLLSPGNPGKAES